MWDTPLLIGGIVTALAVIDLLSRSRKRSTHLLFGCVLGSLLSWGILLLTQAFGAADSIQNPYLLGFAFIVLIIAWKALFGPWETHAKAAILGTFLFWIAFHILGKEAASTRLVHLYSMAIGLVPAVLWCVLFLKYHKERISAVLLLFFSGMLSTAPILFYDMLVRKGVDLQFFLFRVTPENFSASSHGFVSGALVGVNGIQSALFTTLISFLIVGVIEEVSKYWVLRKSGTSIFTSIDDVFELGIIAAIGFAYAENVINPSYFGGFIRDFLLNASQPDVLGFISNILGRSVLTSMVHILSTGVLAYALGLALFAPSYLSERQSHGKHYPFLHLVHKLLQVREVSVFRTYIMLIGLTAAIVLHAMFNFMVTLPDLLPTHPQSIGELLQLSHNSFWNNIPLLLVPSMLYVVGGFWFITSLFLRRENAEERGHLETREVFVRG